MKKTACVLIWISIFVWSAGRAMPAGKPEGKTVRNAVYEASITPIVQGRTTSCPGFVLSIRNDSDQSLSIMWDQTGYLLRGELKGGFMLSDTEFDARNNPKPPTVIPPRGKFYEMIFPGALAYDTGRDRGWFRMAMPQGDNGIKLTLKSGESVMTETIRVTLPEAVHTSVLGN